MVYMLSYHAALGDQLCFTAAVHAFKVAHPFDLVAVDVTFPEIYEGNPDVHSCGSGVGHFSCDRQYIVGLPVFASHRNMTLQEASADQLRVEIEDPTPRMYLRDDEKRPWMEKANDLNGGPLVGLAPDARWDSRCYPLHGWAQVVAYLRELYDARVVGLGKYSRDCPAYCIDWAGTTVRELAAAVSVCDLILATDNGVAHMAAAVGTPAVVLYGPVLGKYRAGELTIPVEGVGCKGCYHELMDVPASEFRFSCPKGKGYECMKSISVEKITDACAKAIDTMKDGLHGDSCDGDASELEAPGKSS